MIYVGVADGLVVSADMPVPSGAPAGALGLAPEWSDPNSRRSKVKLCQFWCLPPRKGVADAVHRAASNYARRGPVSDDVL